METLEDKIETLVNLQLEHNDKLNTNVITPSIKLWSKTYKEPKEELMIKYLRQYAIAYAKKYALLPEYKQIDVIKFNADKLEYSKK